MYCYIALPLDLHVLSLPLAFILSQDQTLHCRSVLILVPFIDEVSHVSASRPYKDTCCSQNGQ